ncbi:MAG: hypothetical protein HQL64_04205 [Magnetococcales bacterium]|nr:hypothetical protein [Magnetococcales bacterium]
MPDKRLILTMGLLLTLFCPPTPATAETWKDPTAPPESSAPSTAQTQTIQDANKEIHFTLSLLLVSAERELAVINGTLVRPGTHVEKALVTSITPRGVRLIYKGHTIDLPAPIQVADPKKYADHEDAS